MNCQTCDKPLSGRHQKQFCSRHCANARYLTGEYRTCQRCGKSFYLSPSLISRHKNGFCSMRCSRGLLVKTGKCLQCGKPILYRSKREAAERKYCSLVCFRMADKRREITSCSVCGKPISRPRSRILRSQYPVCSAACFVISITGENNPGWTGGTDSYRGPNWDQQRAVVRKRDNHTCQSCGKTKQNLQQQLDVHHIRPYRLFDGDHKAANQIDNLITLCHKCHLLIENRLRKTSSPRNELD